MDTPRKKKEDERPETHGLSIGRFYFVVLWPWFLSGCSGIIIVSIAMQGLDGTAAYTDISYALRVLVAVVFLLLWTIFVGSWLERRTMPQNRSENKGSIIPDDASMDTLAAHAQYALGDDGELVELPDENTQHRSREE
jgi:hypothetical protein